MSTIDDINNEIDRIENAKGQIENAIEERGVTVPAGSHIEELPGLIREIPGPVQADWSQDDSTAPDYIKNKPTIPAAPGTLDTDNANAQTVSKNESLTEHVKLHKVSKTGSYADLNNKPTIPAAQIQSDWDQSDSNEKDYIKNKPTIPAAQVQSDWNEADPEKPDYIKNKPTIPAEQVQSDWSENDSEKKSFIKNKPAIPAAQVQSDWGEQDSEKVEFIKNKPTIPTVPEISTNIAADKNSNTKTASPKAVYDEVRPAIRNSQPVGGMIPNVLYNFGQLVGNATFLLAEVSDAAIVNHYYWMFDTPSIAPTITWPSGLSWFGGSAPEIGANKHYEISVLNGIAIAMEV